MMTCPKCGQIYADEYIFCLTDGNGLVSDNEFETVVNPRREAVEKQEITVKCSGCGTEIRVNSKFCKKCGTPLETLRTEGPVAAPTFAQAPVEKKNNSLAMFVGGGAVLAVILVIIYLGSDESRQISSSITNANRPANNSWAMANNRPAMNTATNASVGNKPSDYRIGRTGTLTTDSNLREWADPNSLRLGTHYMGARVRILDVADIVNDEGGTSTWFRLQVTSYGSSRDPKNAGQAKDPGTPDEGWVNSYPKVWDYQTNQYNRVQLVNFD